MNKYFSVSVGAIFLSVPLLTLGAEHVPDAGLRAEGNGQWEEAVKVYRQELGNNPAQVHLWLRIADIQVKLGNLHAAAAALSEGVRHAPRNPMLHAKLSEVHAAANEPQPALAAIDQAVALAPENLEYLRARAKLANWNQDYAKAADSFTRILQLTPGAADAVLGLARANVGQGQLDQAADGYREYMASHADDQAALKEYISVETNRKQYESALALLETYRQHFGESLENWLKTAELQAVAKNPKGAAYALEQAGRLSPDDSKVFFRLSQAYATAQDAKPALAAINRAVEIEPNNIEYLRARGVLATWNADYAAATDSYTRVLALAPEDGEAKLGMARSGMRLGDKDKAAQNYRTYLAEHPQDKVALMEYIELEAERANLAAVEEYGTIYRERFGEDLAYWLRMAEIYALAGDDHASAVALQKATRFAPNDPGLFFRLSQTYPSVVDAKNAMAAINRAVQLEPKNLEYLRAQADLAAWGSDYETALDSYSRILQIAPDDPGAVLGIARLEAWKGEIDAAAKQYQAYLDKNPQVQLVWIEYVEVQTERGNYALAMELLEQYRERFGENAAYQKQKARTLAWADRPTPSLSIVSDLEPTMPDDYELGYTRTVALAGAHRPSDALKSLADLVKLGPDSKETVDIQRYIKTPLRSNVNFSFAYQKSSDHITIKRAGVDGEYVINPETRIFGGTDKQWLHANAGSGFEKVNGSQNLGYERGWLGIRHRLSPQVSLDAQVGAGDADGRGNLIYEVGADLQPKDELSMRVFRRQDIYAVSPRAADLGVLRRANTLTMSWMPSLRYTVDGLLSYDTFSDGNERWELDLAPRRAFVRSQRLNLDLGVGGRWFGFQKNPEHGYYAPNTYERYSLNAYSYWKISDDDGISVSASIGPWKDNTMSGYRTGGDVVVEGFFGLYRDWMLDARGSLSHYGGAETGSYRSSMFELILTRRF